MQIINRLDALRAEIAALKTQGGGVALVPTMGALHAGHMELVNAARARASHVVVSIFVNPAQFGPNEDFDKYPRTLDADRALLEAAKVDVLWAPGVRDVYPEGFATGVSVSGVSDTFDGAARPGHFDGVALIVAKLFNQVQPDFAFFGEKDWQQLAVIRRMARDLDMPLTIEGVPTVREADGLALSSRNRYLSAEQRAAATVFPQALSRAADRIAQGDDVADSLAEARAAILAGGFDHVDYVDLADAATLQPISALEAAPGRLLGAARIGETRLIDNLPVVKSFTG